MDTASPCGNISGVRINRQALREAREAQKLSASELSRRAGFARTYVHRLEDGTRGSNVSHGTVTSLAEALEVEVGALLLADPPEEAADEATGDPQPLPPAPRPEEPDGPKSSATTEADPNPEAWRWG